MSDTPRTDEAEVAFANWKAGLAMTAGEQPNGWQFSRKLERELIAACEERDRYKADSEALDWLIGQINRYKYTNPENLVAIDIKMRGHPIIKQRIEKLKRGK